MSKETFEKSYEIYQPLIYHYLSHKVKNKEDVEDLTQDIFLNCFYYWNLYNEDISSLKTWIYHIANNRLKNYYRDRNNILLLDWDYCSTFDFGGSSSAQLIDDDFSADLLEHYAQQRYLDGIMPCLNPLQIQVLTLRYYHEYSLLEISKEMNLTKENVGVILHRSIRKLRNEIRKQGYVYGF